MGLEIIQVFPFGIFAGLFAWFLSGKIVDIPRGTY